MKHTNFAIILLLSFSSPPILPIEFGYHVNNSCRPHQGGGRGRSRSRSRSRSRGLLLEEPQTRRKSLAQVSPPCKQIVMLNLEADPSANVSASASASVTSIITLHSAKNNNIDQTTGQVFKCFGPLLGGPSWLQLHQMVVLTFPSTNQVYLVDFLPANPTQPSVLMNLLLFREVPGVVRLRRKPMRTTGYMVPKNASAYGENIREVEEIQAFTAVYNSNLSLIRNNCKTFADAFIQYCTKL